jgi:hypothetical protein
MPSRTAHEKRLSWNDDNSSEDQEYAGKMLCFWIRDKNCGDKVVRTIAATFITTSEKSHPSCGHLHHDECV